MGTIVSTSQDVLWAIIGYLISNSPNPLPSLFEGLENLKLCVFEDENWSFH